MNRLSTSYNQNTGQIDAESLTNLTRRVDGTLTVYCIYSGGICGNSTGTTLTRDYTYVGDETVSSD